MIPGPALLFCPGDRPDRFAKALERADAVILDLEDAVAPEAKVAARATLVAALPALDRARTIVRINAAGTPWHDDDVAALRGAGVAVMLPKAESPDQLDRLAGLEVLALCETARGIEAATAIAASAACAGLVLGTEDLIASLGGWTSRTAAGELRGVIEHARWRILVAAAAAGLPAIDGVHVALHDAAALEREAADAAAAGYRAKACIHPAQVDPIRRAFRPPETQVQWARGVLAAAGASGDAGVFTYEGKMVDAPLLRHAEAIVRAADRP